MNPHIFLLSLRAENAPHLPIDTSVGEAALPIGSKGCGWGLFRAHYQPVFVPDLKCHTGLVFVQGGNGGEIAMFFMAIA